MRTIAPASRLRASSGTTRKQLERASAARSPEPCQGTSATSGRWPAVAPNVQDAGKKRVSPGQPRKCETGAVLKTAGERSQHRRRKEQEGDGGGDRIAGKAEEALRAAFFLDGMLVPDGQLAEDQRLAGLDANAVKVKASANAGQGRLDKIELPRRNAAGDEQQVSVHCLNERGVERLRGVGCRGQHPRLSARRRNHRGQHGGVRVADLT